MNEESIYTQAALDHLISIKPFDGWSVQKCGDSSVFSSQRRGRVKLLRRSISLSDQDDDFVALWHDSTSGVVVGVQSITVGSGAIGRGVVLVEADGTVCRTPRSVCVSRPNLRNKRMAEATTATPMADRARQEMEELVQQGGNLTPEQQRQILQYAAGAILSSILLKVVFQAMFYVYIVALPLVYLYCVQTCPSNESFDAKKEIKRVLRGHHLPENHPDKPKGFLTNALNRLQATVATEVATGLGYEVSLYVRNNMVWRSSVCLYSRIFYVRLSHLSYTLTPFFN